MRAREVARSGSTPADRYGGSVESLREMQYSSTTDGHEFRVLDLADSVDSTKCLPCDAAHRIGADQRLLVARVTGQRRVS
jgi:hypothetical protein